MKKEKIRKGFTMLEILVVLALLVTVVGLSAFLYTRAAKLRKLITYQNDIQSILNTMISEIIYGTRDSIGLQFAYDIKNDPQNSFYELGFYDATKAETIFYLISPGMNSGKPSALPTTDTDTTLWHAKTKTNGVPARNSGEWKLIDANKVIQLTSGSGFIYYSLTNTGLKQIDSLSSETPVAVKITLKGKTTDPSLKTRPVTTLEVLVRCRNKLPF